MQFKMINRNSNKTIAGAQQNFGMDKVDFKIIARNENKLELWKLLEH